MTLHLFVRFDTGAHTDDVGRALLDCTTPTLAEDGCLEYRSFKREDNQAIFLKEEWQDEAALDRHMETPHLKRFISEVERITGRPADDVIHMSKTAPLA